MPFGFFLEQKGFELPTIIKRILTTKKLKKANIKKVFIMEEKLSKYQRLSLLNQYNILRELAIIRGDKKEADRYKEFITIITNGYVGEYNYLTEHLLDEFPEDESEFVWNTLEMYSYIYSSFKNIEKPQIDESKILFPGFDYYYESDYYEFCRYVLFDLKMFDELTENDRTDFNSHCRCCSKYHVMLNKWKNMGGPLDLSEKEIIDLI